MAHPLQELVHKGWLWQGREATEQLAPEQFIDSGWPDLNRRLGGGWLRGAVHELQVRCHFQGELALLMPTLVAQQKPCLWVNPPAMPYWPGLAHRQLARAPLWLQERDPKLALWAIEQALKSETLGVVVAWLNKPEAAVVRRLQQIAAKHDQLVFIVTAWQATTEARAYVNRLQLDWQNESLQIAILKRRAGWPLPAFPCAVSSFLPPRRQRSA